MENINYHAATILFSETWGGGKETVYFAVGNSPIPEDMETIVFQCVAVLGHLELMKHLDPNADFWVLDYVKKPALMNSDFINLEKLGLSKEYLNKHNN